MTVQTTRGKAFSYLGISIAVSLVLALPLEQIAHQTDWGPSCDDVVTWLDIGGFLRAVLTPLCVFLLPGPGAILRGRIFSSSRVQRLRNGKNLLWFFMGVGWASSAAISIIWWYAIRALTVAGQNCAYLFHQGPSDPYRPDSIADCAHYFWLLSVFAGLWAGIAAGGLRVHAARVEAGVSGNDEIRFHGFYWACFLGWAVQYRLSQWFTLTHPDDQEWIKWAFVNFAFVTGSAFWVLAFVRGIWRKEPQKWFQAVLQLFWKSIAVYLLTTFTFFLLLFYYAFLAVVPAILTWDIFGLLWAFGVGTLHWNAVQQNRKIVPAGV